ncbi:terminase large subunit [Bacillus thuringiensis]|uniref:Terminase large subunit n=2 Tax=Bacillus cereus group TaxID=86661 RepID=A0ABD5I2Y8_BACTU|nr:terminase TerL endonuclease subunit [Bacillus thuringiensis]MCR6781521.1 terminase large subunit [Bacillus thuringiensis]MCR6859591.1 terminase large subunit [Bacillus thuringiensis]MCR6865190.1 terminase large subunit [Bacillus thuringiensis]MDW9211629.1 terminase large subunit [Bacillus thuringiensis serovar toumanoffi]MED2620306.1 terminase large subunit [Bacillus thuringiensis]
MIITLGVNYADKYANNVMRNKKKYPKSIILAVERYKKWKKRKNIWFDVDRANEMLDFVQSFIRHVKGPLAGQLMELELWEMFVFANMYGWYHKNEKGKTVRVIRESYVQVPKKNGKTIIAAGALLYAMYGELELGADCYCAASDYEQAQNAAEPIAQAIENSEPLARHTQIYKGVNGTVSGAMYRYSINGIAYQNKFKVLTKNTKGLEGKNPYFVLNDELHAQENMDMYDNLKSAQISREQPIMLNISTAGKGASSVGMRVYKYAKLVLENDDDDSLFVAIWEPNKNYDWEDRKVWEMVNPNIGVSVTMETLEIEFKKAKQSAHSKAEFLSKHLNVFVNGAENYFEHDQVQHVLVEDLGDLTGEICYLGLDLSKTTDLTCVSLNFPSHNDEGRSIIKVKQMYFLPNDNIDFKEKEDNVPYTDMVERGFATFCDGKMIDQDQVMEYIVECMDLYDVQQINYDPAMSQKLIEKLENLGLECIAVNQYPNVMNAMLDDSEILIYEKRLITDNPLFVYCALNVVVVTNINGMKAPSKRQSKKKIDGFVAFLVAHKETMMVMDSITEEGMDELIGDIYR